MVIKASRAVLTERCRLMCRQRGRQHVLVLARVHRPPELVGCLPKSVLKPQWLVVPCSASHQRTVSMAREVQRRGSPTTSRSYDSGSMLDALESTLRPSL